MLLQDKEHKINSVKRGDRGVDRPSANRARTHYQQQQRRPITTVLALSSRLQTRVFQQPSNDLYSHRRLEQPALHAQVVSAQRASQALDRLGGQRAL